MEEIDFDWEVEDDEGVSAGGRETKNADDINIFEMRMVN